MYLATYPDVSDAGWCFAAFLMLDIGAVKQACRAVGNVHLRHRNLDKLAKLVFH